jgi:hypothetical protein
MKEIVYRCFIICALCSIVKIKPWEERTGYSDMRNVAEDRRIILMGCEEDMVRIELNTVTNLWVR